MLRQSLRPDPRIELTRRQLGYDGALGYAIIDMGADNYTLTKREVEAGIKLFTNVGTGKKATIPIEFFPLLPPRFILATYYTAATMILKLEASTELSLPTALIFDVISLPESDILDLASNLFA